MLVRTNKRIAGFPPPGVVGEVDDERGRAAPARGDVEDMTSLSARLGRKPEDVTGVEDAEIGDARLEGPTPSGDSDAFFDRAADALDEEKQDVSGLLDDEVDLPEVVRLPADAMASIKQVAVDPKGTTKRTKAAGKNDA